MAFKCLTYAHTVLSGLVLSLRETEERRQQKMKVDIYVRIIYLRERSYTQGGTFELHLVDNREPSKGLTEV